MDDWIYKMQVLQFNICNSCNATRKLMGSDYGVMPDTK